MASKKPCKHVSPIWAWLAQGNVVWRGARRALLGRMCLQVCPDCGAWRTTKLNGRCDTWKAPRNPRG